MSSLIRQTLALHALEDRFGSLEIVEPESLAMVVPMIVLRKVAVQMVVPTVLIYALHAALEYREESFDGVGVHGRVG